MNRIALGWAVLAAVAGCGPQVYHLIVNWGEDIRCCQNPGTFAQYAGKVLETLNLR